MTRSTGCGGWLACALAVGCGPAKPDDDGSDDVAMEDSTATTGSDTRGDDDDGDDGSTGDTNGEPAPGQPGGLCVLIDGLPSCSVEGALCNADGNYCFLPDAPCEGFACGGEDRGTCTPQDDRPSCTCMPGYDNEQFALYCCPLAGGDPNCV